LTDLLPRWAEYAHIQTLFSAVVGGALSGLGILFFIRHRGSLGGIGILAVYLQRERGWSVGKVQMSFDAMLMLVALLCADLGQGAVFGHRRVNAESGVDVQSPPASVYGGMRRAEDACACRIARFTAADPDGDARSVV